MPSNCVHFGDLGDKMERLERLFRAHDRVKVQVEKPSKWIAECFYVYRVPRVVWERIVPVACCRCHSPRFCLADVRSKSKSKRSSSKNHLYLPK
jgi:hypothetical protein